MNIIPAKKPKIICYGDSNTFGHDPRSYIGDRFPPDVRWTGILNQAGWEAVNCGLNGRKIPAAEAEILAAAEQIGSHLPADIVAVMLGTNDLLWDPSLAAEDAAEAMGRFLQRLLPAVGGAKLLLIAPPAMQRGRWAESEYSIAQSARLGALYAALAAEFGVLFADAAQWHPEISFDGVHLTENGHRTFAQQLLAVLHTFPSSADRI